MKITTNCQIPATTLVVELLLKIEIEMMGTTLVVELLLKVKIETMGSHVTST
jgi:hypothetical protein